MKNFLIVYSKQAGRVLECFEYPEAEHDRALTHRFDLEARNAAASDTEVIVLTAASIDDLMRTHSRYFPETLEKRVAAL